MKWFGCALIHIKNHVRGVSKISFNEELHISIDNKMFASLQELLQRGEILKFVTNKMIKNSRNLKYDIGITKWNIK